MNLTQLKAYELIKEEPLKEIDSIGYLLKHKKSGARIALVTNSDENKVFQITFRTPPYNDGGLPHILEHSVLCGSKNFPVKDPFVELMKGSLNTFLNAMTGPDKTMYPIASCNDKDFQNLMHVYMDAVFYPNLHEREEIFRQEGWSYQLEDKEAPLQYNGVVYNEMKGAYAAPDEVLAREISNVMFPDTCYASDFGGDPDEIPNLTYEEFKAFHKKYYHPCNSYIYLYGDMDMEEKLNWMDEAYLSKFDAIDVDSEIQVQAPFGVMQEKVIEYPIASGESEKEKALLSWNVTAGSELDPREYIAFEVLNYALLAQPGAVLREALLDAGIGKDITGGYSNSVLQPYFSVIAKDADIEQKDEFLKIIYDVLTEVVEKGFDKESLKAGINGLEFRNREVDFGRYPKGLIFGMTAMDSWLYDENDPFLHLKTDEVYSYLKEQMNCGYFEGLVEKYLLSEEHCAFVAAVPKEGLNSVKEHELEEKLQAYKASLSEEELDRLVEKTEGLQVYQEEPSTKEELESIPLLKLEDIKKEVTPITYDVKEIDGVPLVDKELFTNKIAYLNFAFRMESVPKRLLPYVGVLKYLVAYVDTQKHTYSELANEINIHSGGLNCDVNVYDRSEQGDYIVTFECDTKVLYEELPFAFSIVKEVLFESDYSDGRRIKDILNEMKSHLANSLPNSSTASRRAMSYFAESYELREILGGVTFYEWLEVLISEFDQRKEETASCFHEICEILFQKKNLVLNFTGTEEARTSYMALAKEFVEALPEKEQAPCDWKFDVTSKLEGLKTSAQIQFVAQAGNFKKAGFKFHGSMRVLRSILVNDYLWNNIRVKGGAYGCGCNFTRTGMVTFSTYRDPHLKRSLNQFAKISEYIRNFACDEREMLKFIIGTISDLDAPLTPAGLAEQAFIAYFHQVDDRIRQKDRDEILATTVEQIRSLADMLDAVIVQNQYCVIGNEEKIEESELFLEKRVLIH